MAWIPVTEDDLLTVLNGKELEGVREAALGLGQADPVEPTIKQVVNQVRGAVAACDGNELGAGDTIPDELLAAALDILALRILSRVGQSTDARQDSAEKAAALLNRVADCKFYIQPPATASTEDAAPPRPSITARTRRFNRDSQDGI